MQNMKLIFRNGNTETIECKLEDLRTEIRAASEKQNSELFQMVTLNKIERLVTCIG